MSDSAREPSHTAIIQKMDEGFRAIQHHVDLKFMEVETRAEERHEATVGRLSVLENQANGFDARIGHLQGSIKSNPATMQREDGIPFQKGWPRRVAIGALIVAMFGGAVSFFRNIFEIASAMQSGIAAFFHSLNPPH